MGSDASRCHQNGVGYIIKVVQGTPAAIIYIFAKFFEVQLRVHGADKRGKERTTER